jgi:hypothetical protein
VFVIKGDRIESQRVRLGARTAAGLIILAGLEPGVAVAVGELDKLRDGARVEVLP